MNAGQEDPPAVAAEEEDDGAEGVAPAINADSARDPG